MRYWQCKYHVVWCPKYRFRILQRELGRSLRAILRQLCERKKIKILEGNIQVDHIHLVLSIPPKYSISKAIGFLKGKSAIKIFDMHHELND
jgi:putative transposase